MEIPNLFPNSEGHGEDILSFFDIVSTTAKTNRRMCADRLQGMIAGRHGRCDIPQVQELLQPEKAKSKVRQVAHAKGRM